MNQIAEEEEIPPLKLSTNWLRLAISIQLCLQPALLAVLHNHNIDASYTGLPDDQIALYQVLIAFKSEKYKKLKTVLKDYQWDGLCPVSGETDSSTLDVTTIVVLIINLLNLTPPQGGWKISLPKSGDTNISAFVLLARRIRNEIFHYCANKMNDQTEFESCWDKMTQILVGLKYGNIAFFGELKTSSLNDYQEEQQDAISARLNELESRVEEMQNNLSKKAKLEDGVESNSQEIQLLKEIIAQQQQQLTPSSSHGSLYFSNSLPYSTPDSQSIIDDLDTLSEMLKTKTEERYADVTEKTPVKHNSNFPTRCSREDIIVDVTLRETHIPTRELDEGSLVCGHFSNSITDSWKNNVIIVGEPGIGKSTLVETMMYRWSQGKVWSGSVQGDVEYKFVFILYFRDLNRYTANKKITAKKILKKEFTDIFDKINMKTLRIIKDKVLLILEGFDECNQHEEISKHQRSNFVQAVYDLINPDNSELPFKRILTSRPNSYSIILHTFDKCYFKTYEITGFSKDNIKRYTEIYFRSSENRIKTILQKIDRSALLSAVIHIPFFCWGICYLFNDALDKEIPETYTSLYGHLLLLFLRNHGRYHGKTTGLREFLESQHCKETILIFAKLAYTTLVDRRYTFGNEEFKVIKSKVRLDPVKLVQQSGLLVKKDTDTSDRVYSFMHSTFHEFLAAVYIFHKGNSVLKHCKTLHGVDSTVLPLVAGLIGGLRPSSASGHLISCYARSFHNKTINESWSIDHFIDMCMQLPDINRTQMFLSCVYEFHNPIHCIKPVILFGVFNKFDYKRLCLQYLSESLKKGIFNIKTLVLFFDDELWSTVIPYVRKVSLHLMPSSEFLLSSLPCEILSALRDKALNLKKLEIKQNIALTYVFEFIPYIECVEVMGYIEDLRVLRSILSGMNSEEVVLRTLTFHLAEECNICELVELSEYVETFKLIVRGNTTTKVHKCSNRCIQKSTRVFLENLCDYVSNTTYDSSFHASASCWFESEDSDYIYLVTQYRNFTVL